MPHGQIVRDDVPTVDPAESRTARSWAWVCAALVNRDKGECAVPIVDSVFIDKHKIWAWYYTNANGIVRRKAPRKLNPEHVLESFEVAADAPRDADDAATRFIAVCWFDDTTRNAAPFFTAHELTTFLGSLGPSDGRACLSVFIHPRGDLDPTCYANLEHDYVLHKNGRPQGKLFRVALGRQRIASMDSKLNAAVNDAVQRYISFIERSKKCRVVRCVSLFLLAHCGRLYLWRTREFDTIPVPAFAVEGSSTSDAYNGPRAVDERLVLRAKAEEFRRPDEQLIDAILTSPTPHRKAQLLPASQSNPQLGIVPEKRKAFNPFDDAQSHSWDPRHAQLRDSHDWDKAMQFLPLSSTFSRGRRRALSAAHLASSQKRGCGGDYCHLSVLELSSKRMVRGSKGIIKTLAGSNNIANSLGATSSSVATDGAMVNAKGRHNSVASATAAANAFLATQQAASAGRRDSAFDLKPGSPQRQQRDRRGGGVGGDSSGDHEQSHTIPFKLIAQTRAEKQLVDLFLRRYQNGEDGDYLAEAYYGDGEPLGQTFPGYYYQEVRVCRNCYELYSLVEQVRMQSLDRIARTSKASRRGRERAKSVRAPSSYVAPSLVLPAITNECDERDEEEADEDDEPRASQRREDALDYVWQHVWTQAEAIARSITKRDAAELYSFVSPHPAVAMVFSALSVLLLGKEGDAGALKRAISQEQLVATLEKISPDEVTLATLLKGADHARNTLFTPANVAPISACAARFCEWFLAVLQALAWKMRMHVRDFDTCRLLCFLNTDRLPPGVSLDALSTPFGGGSLTGGHHQAIPRSSLRVDADAAATWIRTGQRHVARRSIQVQQMARLAAPAGLISDTATGSAIGASKETVFTCHDGVTRIPYAVVGQAVGATTKCNLVVFHDLFDTLDGTRVFFRALLARNVGARVLVFNMPGQAGTTYPMPMADGGADKSTDKPADKSTDKSAVLNNMWTVERVHELLVYLQESQAFITRGLPFHLVGFGNGANVAACYAVQHGKAFGDDLRSVALLNGFARVDAQLAAVLHSAVNVFACLPPARPDLPVSFFSKFLFSDAYLRKVDPNLALSIYTAVTNTITLDGRIRVCQGALHHVDLSPLLGAIDAPLVLVQSVENALVAPANVDPFLQGRARVLHAWSHQQSHTSDLRGKTRAQLRQTLGARRSVFVSWLRAGHELRQEAKTFVTELLEFLVNVLEKPSAEELAAGSSGAAGGEKADGPVEEATSGAAKARAASQQGRRSTHSPGPALVSTGRDQIADCDTAVAPTSATSKAKPQAAEPSPSPSTKATPTPSTTTSAPPTRKSAYELQLERSEREFQEAVKTHEAQRAEFEKRAWLLEEKQRRRLQQAAASSHSSTAVPTCHPQPTTSPSMTTTAHAKAASTSAGSTGKLALGAIQPDFPPAITSSSMSDAGDSAVPAVPRDAGASIAATEAAGESVRSKLAVEQARGQTQAAELLEKQRAASEARLEALRREQEARRQQWEAEDRARLDALEQQRREQEAERVREFLEREKTRLARDLETMSVTLTPRTVRAPVASALPSPSTPTASPAIPPSSVELPSLFDQMEAEEEAARRSKRTTQPTGSLSVDAFAAVREQTQRAFSEGVRAHESSLREQLQRRKSRLAVRIQSAARRWLAVRSVARLRARRQRELMRTVAGAELVRVARGFLGRRRFIRVREAREDAERRARGAVEMQKLARGFVCRRRFARKLRAAKAGVLQRVFRGHRGRAQCRALRDERAKVAVRSRHATKLQATWKMHTARDKFLAARFATLAATELQRVYRGHVGRREVRRKRQWREASPGAERLTLGLQLIEGSKHAVERQQHEMDALHRAQEQVEAQVSAVHAELQASEQELAVLERELQEIDQLDADLRELTHEAAMLQRGVAGGASSAGPPLTLGDGVMPVKGGASASDGPTMAYDAQAPFESREAARQRQADLYALEMAMQIKRGEREKKKRDLEAEFTSVFGEVQQKRAALAAMEQRLADMEATRLRKDREFARLQRQLMELLEEQKLELERLREKGIELETATATSAAAAAATAAKARAHEERSQAMFESTEELMKFQFMSMSLSYFSSLNMLKNLRDMNADTTAAAITSTAETAATAAAAAAAANIPLSVSKLPVGMTDVFVRGDPLRQQEDELARARAAERAAEEHAAKAQPMPEDVHEWSVDDVGRWLEALALAQYARAFREGAVDGAFLLELRAEDLADVLGVTHPLHVRKILVARDKLRPLSDQERAQLAAVRHEQSAAQTRTGAASGVGAGAMAGSARPPLDVATVFSQARNGRAKRLVESLEAGFDVDAEDDKGNTLLVVACQNVNRALVEMLVARRADVNHRNAQGNTPLHFAMAYDTDGALGEFLIAHGADDTIENAFGLTPYDGLSPD